MSKAKIVMASLVWLLLLTAGVSLYRLWYVPSKKADAEQQQQQVAQEAEQQRQQLLNATSGSSSYDHEISIGLDAFSGYAVLRSDEFKQELRGRGIKLDLTDDGADYNKRLEALASGELHMAAFPVDALLRASEKRSAMPATVVAILDETRGADAILGYKSKFPNVDSLNADSTRFVLVGDSPSETLARVLMHSFKMENLSANAFTSVASEQEVLRKYKAATPGGNEVFVTWEPVISQLLENEQLHVLFDSSKQSGFIVDAMVVSRDYLIKNESVVQDTLESYFKALYSFSERQALTNLIRQDAAAGGLTLSDAQAENLVNGIVWKNTQENLAHFGLRNAAVPHIEDMIDRIKRVLLETGGLEKDPTGGNSSKLFYEQVLRDMQSAGYHPGVDVESIREDSPLANLSEQQWSRLEPVGTVDVPPLIYARGTSRLTSSSKAKLDTLIETLGTFPRYYLMVRGDASSRGDAEANRILAKQRAEAALQYLQENGVPAARLRVVDGAITGKTSVTFVLGQLPY